MKHSPNLQANSHSKSQEISRLLWNLEVRFPGYKGPPLVAILSQIHLVHTFPSYFLKIYSNTILPSTPRFSEWSLPFM